MEPPKYKLITIVSSFFYFTFFGGISKASDLAELKAELAKQKQQAAEAQKRTEALERLVELEEERSKLLATLKIVSVDKKESVEEKPKMKTSGDLGTINLNLKKRWEKGWFERPEDQGSEVKLRYSDGKNWTKHVVLKSDVQTYENEFEPVPIQAVPEGPASAGDIFDSPKEVEPGYELGRWNLDWQLVKGGTRFIYDSDTNSDGTDFDAFQDGALGYSLEFLSLYAHQGIPGTELEWGPSFGVGIAGGTEDGESAAVMMTSLGVFLRPDDKPWQLEFGAMNAISGQDSLEFSMRNDSALYLGLTIGSMFDSAKDAKK